MHGTSLEDFGGCPWGFTDVNENGVHDGPGRRIALAFWDRRPFADGRRETMHGQIVALVEQLGVPERARATCGDAVVILFEGASWAPSNACRTD